MSSHTKPENADAEELVPIPGRPKIGRDRHGVIRALTPKPTTDEQRASYLEGLSRDYPHSTLGSREHAADQWLHVARLRERAGGKKRPSALLLAELGRAEGRLQRARRACAVENAENRPPDWAERRRQAEQQAHIARVRASFDDGD